MGNVEAHGWWFSQVPVWLICDTEISEGAKVLFCYLKWRQGTDAACWPAKATIGHDMDVSIDTVERRLSELEENGYIVKHLRNGQTTLYQMIADPAGKQAAWDARENERRAASSYTIGIPPRKNAPPSPPQKCPPLPPAKMPPHDDTHVTENHERKTCSAHAENTKNPQKPKQTPEQELDAFFGSPHKREMPPTTHWTERTSQPWTGWSLGHFRERDGVSVDAQERVAWLVERETGLRPPSSSYTGWANGCIAVYQAARGDWAAIEDGIKEAGGRQRDFVPRTLACTVKNADQNGFVKAALAAWAERQRPPAPQAVAVNVYT